MKILGREPGERKLPTHNAGPESLAYDFNRYFVKKIEDIRQPLLPFLEQQVSTPSTPRFTAFEAITEQDLYAQ